MYHMQTDSIYNYIYSAIHHLDIVGLFWIAQLVAAQYKLLVGIM